MQLRSPTTVTKLITCFFFIESHSRNAQLGIPVVVVIENQQKEGKVHEKINLYGTG